MLPIIDTPSERLHARAGPCRPRTRGVMMMDFEEKGVGLCRTERECMTLVQTDELIT